MDSLDPGAWNSEAMVTALARTQELFEEELIDPLWSSIDWADADTIVAKYEAVFKPDGQWWVASNRDKLPEDFDPGYAPVPTIPECEGSPSLIQANAEPSWMVPAEAKHPRGGMEWIRLWDSKPFSVVFAEVCGDLLPIEGSGEGADWPAASAEMLEYFRQAERYYNPMHHLWYGDLMSAHYRTVSSTGGDSLPAVRRLPGYQCLLGQPPSLAWSQGDDVRRPGELC